MEYPFTAGWTGAVWI